MTRSAGVNRGPRQVPAFAPDGWGEWKPVAEILSEGSESKFQFGELLAQAGWSVSLPGDDYGRAGTAQFGQVAIRGHPDLDLGPYSANDRAVIVGLQQRALQASPSRTSAMTRVPELTRLACLGDRSCLFEGCRVHNAGACRDQLSQRLAGSRPIHAGLCRGTRRNPHRAYAASSRKRWQPCQSSH